jgi:integrase
VLSQLLDAAVEGGKLSRNVAAGVKPPRVQRAEMCFLDAGQVEALAEAIDPRYAPLIRFGADSGLRPSELTALKIGRLDLLRGTVRVVEAATEVDGRLHWGGVKTHEARTVRLPRSITDELAAHLASRPHGPEDLVFPAPLGGPMRWSKWTRRYFKPVALAAGLPERLRLYDLRHSCASLLIREGATVKAVQAQLGHATASITLDTYGHLFPDELDQLAGRLEAARAATLDARAASAWPHGGPSVVLLGKGAGR